MIGGRSLHARLSSLRAAAVLLSGGFLLAWLPLNMAALAVAALAGGLLIVSWPPAAASLVALAVPFGSLWGLRLGPLQADAADLAVLALAGWWLGGMLLAGEVRLRPDRVVWGAAAWLGALALSALPAQSLPLAVKEVAKWAQYLLVYLAVRDRLPAKGRAWVAGAALLGGGLQAMLGLQQFLAGSGPEAFRILGGFSRAYGTFQQPNPFGGFLALLFPLAVALALDPEALRRRPLLGLVAWAVLPLLAAGILLSFSRAAWLGAAAGSLAVLALRSRRAAGGTLLAAGLGATLAFLGGLALVPQFVSERMRGLVQYGALGGLDRLPVTDHNFAVLERLAHWLAGYRMFAQQPLLGVGAGNYPAAYPAHALPGWPDPLGHAHNVPLNVAAETGLVGLAAFLVLLGTASYTAWVWARSGTGLGRALAWGTLGAWMSVTIFNLFDSLFVHGVPALLGLLLGLCRPSGPAAGGEAAHRREVG